MSHYQLSRVNTRAFILMHDEAFTYFGGVLEECVYDQSRLVVIKEEFREVWFNEEFYQYVTLAHFALRVCEGYDPQSKGKVEAGVKYVKNSLFYGEEFLNFGDLQQKRLFWLEEVANVRIHGTTQKKPKDVFEASERTKLKPCFSPGFILEDCAQTRKVDKTSLISYKSNKYSVSSRYQSGVVLVQEEETNLVIQDLETRAVIARHSLFEGKGFLVKNTNHYREHEKLVEDREKEVAQIIECSELAEELCKGLKKTSPKIYKDQLVGLIEVLKGYACREDIHKPLRELSKRSRLTVTFIRDYLAGFYSARRSQALDSGDSNGTLSAYGRLSLKEEIDYV